MDRLPAARALLRGLYLDALGSVRGDALVEGLGRVDRRMWRIRHQGRAIDWRLPTDGRLIVIGAGKAAASMAKGLEAVLGDRIDDGCIIVKHGHGQQLTRIRQSEAGHPLPDQAGVDATVDLLRTTERLTERDCVIVALTGGASALMVAPVEGVTLADKAAATEMLLRSGASIEEINWVRKRLSKVKGGRLLDHLGRASILTLLISDVPSGDEGMIGSGPTIPAYDTDQAYGDIVARYGLERHLAPAIVRRLMPDVTANYIAPSDRHISLTLASSDTLVQAVEALATERGLPTRVVNAFMTGNTHDAARNMVAAMRAVRPQHRPTLLIAAGETTLTVHGDGRGGRNQEFALVAGLELDGTVNMALLAAGTDGTDGPTDAAGAFADGQLLQRAEAAGLDARQMLAQNDSGSLFERTGDLFHTGPTGTNVMDLVLGLVW